MATNQPQSNDNKGTPLCNCNKPACQRTVAKEGPNKGRLFWGCGQWSSTDKSKGCRFFEWATTPMASSSQPEQEATASTVQEKITTGGQPVKILTFNIAGFQPHSFAPSGFDPQQALAEKIDQLQPDVLALQELRSPNFAHPGYYCVGTAQSHCGYVALLAKNKFLQPQEQQQSTSKETTTRMTRVPLRMTMTSTTTMMAPEPPMVIGFLPLPDNQQLIVISCHLEPYGEGAATRHAQIQALTNSLPPLNNTNCRVILAGDMNVRNKEDQGIESLEWTDAWKQAGRERRHEYTWNSKINHYHGEEGFQFTCRFDRVYSRNTKGVSSFQLIANDAMVNKDLGERYYLSDHFGILTTVMI